MSMKCADAMDCLQVVERRALQIREDDIIRFTNEVSNLDCTISAFMALDEVSFDNKGMLRRRGRAPNVAIL